MENVSQLFDWARFGACLRREIMLDGRKWLLRALAIFAVTIFLVCYCEWPSNYQIQQRNVNIDSWPFDLFIYLIAIMGASLFMENADSPGKRLNTLMSPSSTLEKYFSRIIICNIAFPLVFIASFAIAALLRIYLIQLVYGNIVNFDSLDFSDFFDLNGIINFLVMQTTFMLGSTVWPKNSFLKTFAAIIACACIFSILSNFIWVMGLTVFADNERSFFNGRTIVKSLEYVFGVLWIVFCYVTAYFRMKESEIIHRL